MKTNSLKTLTIGFLLLGLSQACLAEEIAEAEHKSEGGADVVNACFGGCGKGTNHLLTHKVKGSKQKIDEILKDRAVINPDTEDGRGRLEGKKKNEPQGT